MRTSLSLLLLLSLSGVARAEDGAPPVRKRIINGSFSLGGGTGDVGSTSRQFSGLSGGGSVEFLLGRMTVGPWIDGSYSSTTETSAKSTNHTKASATSAGPKGRYFFGDIQSHERIIPFVGLGLGLGESHNVTPTSATSSHFSNLWLSLGQLIFLSDDVALDASLKLQEITYHESGAQVNRGDLYLGLSIFL